MSNFAKTILFAAFAAAMAGSVYQAIVVRRQRAVVTSMRQSVARVGDALQRNRSERDEALRQVADREATASRSALGPTSSSVPVSDSEEQRWWEGSRQLRQLAAENPERAIPEMALLKDDDWGLVARRFPLDTPENRRKALGDLRNQAKMNLGRLLQDAIREYAAAHDGLLPTEVAQLAPFVPTAPEGALQRYEMLHAGKLGDLAPNAMLVAERIPVDEQFDTRQVIGLGGYGQATIDRARYLGTRALAAFKQANPGRLPTSALDLQPFLESSLDPAELAAFFASWETFPGPLGPGLSRWNGRKMDVR